MENKSKEELIKELKANKIKLVELETQYSALIDNSLVGVYSTNRNGEILFANKALANILEYDSVNELKKVKSKSFYKIPEQRELLLAKLNKYNKVTNFEIELITKNKTIKHVLLNEFKKNDIMNGMMLDITLRKTYLNDLMISQEELEQLNFELESRVKKRTRQLEKSYLQLIRSKNAAKENEQKFKSIVENVSDLIFIIDKKGFITFISPSSKDLLGYDNLELLGTNKNSEQLSKAQMRV